MPTESLVNQYYSYQSIVIKQVFMSYCVVCRSQHSPLMCPHHSARDTLPREYEHVPPPLTPSDILKTIINYQCVQEVFSLLYLLYIYTYRCVHFTQFYVSSRYRLSPVFKINIGRRTCYSSYVFGVIIFFKLLLNVIVLI